MESAPNKRILILGGGFAGLTVVMELDKKLAQDLSVEITLANRGSFFCSLRCFTRGIEYEHYF